MNDGTGMTVKKMKIGISQRIVNEQNYVEKRDALSHDWTNFLEEINLIPVFIPNSLSDTTSFLESFGLNGMILSGGDNLLLKRKNLVLVLFSSFSIYWH